MSSLHVSLSPDAYESNHHTGAMCLDSGKVALDPCEPNMSHMTALEDLGMGEGGEAL
jgi:hypothetical protein